MSPAHVPAAAEEHPGTMRADRTFHPDGVIQRLAVLPELPAGW